MTIARDWKLETGDCKNGQSLIEVLVAFGVMVMVGMALITASLATQRTSNSARSKSQATELTQTYLEQVRVIRDIKGFSYITNGCFTITNSSNSDPSQWSLASGCVGTTPCNAAAPYNGELVPLNSINYCRKVTFYDIPGGVSKKAVVEVTWKEGTNDRSVSNETIISKWCGGQVKTDGSLCL